MVLPASVMTGDLPRGWTALSSGGGLAGAGGGAGAVGQGGDGGGVGGSGAGGWSAASPPASPGPGHSAVSAFFEYVDWNHGEYPNRPFTVTGTKQAPWLFRGTGLHDGDTFGVYGIEVDARAGASPPHTRVLAHIPGIFGAGKNAEMTYYTTPRGAKVFSAGGMNFGGSAQWPTVTTLMLNIWTELSRP